jgi:hypothetical protein
MERRADGTVVITWEGSEPPPAITPDGYALYGPAAFVSGGDQVEWISDQTGRPIAEWSVPASAAPVWVDLHTSPGPPLANLETEWATDEDDYLEGYLVADEDDPQTEQRRRLEAERRDVQRCLAEPWPFDWTPPRHRADTGQRMVLAEQFGPGWWAG